MTFLDVTKTLSEVLTSAFGKGWGWMSAFLLARLFKKRRFRIALFITVIAF